MQETRLHRTECRSWEGCQEFHEWLESLTTNSGKFEWQWDCSRVSLSLKEMFLSRIVVPRPWWSEPPRKTIFATKCLRMALSCATVVPHFTWCHILHSYERSISFWNCREWKQNRPESGSPSLVSFPDHFSPNREKLGLGLGKVDCWAYGYLNW